MTGRRHDGVRKQAWGVPQPARAGGFTLIEMLVVLAIVAVVAGTIGACLAAGIRVWDRTRTFGLAETEATLALEVMARDLRNSFMFFDIPFQATAAEISFPGLVREGGAESGGVERIGTIGYFFVPAVAALMRSAAVYPADEAAAEAAESLISGIGGLSLSFCDPAAGGAWQSEWMDRTNRPDAVRIGLELLSGDVSGRVERVVVLRARGLAKR